MSEDKKPTAIGELINKMTSGFEKAKAGTKSPQRDSTANDEVIVGEPVNEHDDEYASAGKQNDNVEPGFENNEDPLIAEFDQVKPARPTLKDSMKKMTLKQKVAAVAIVIVAVFALKNHFSSAPEPTNETAGITEAPEYIDESLELPSTTLSREPGVQEELPLPGFEFDDPMFSGMSAPEGKDLPVQETEAQFPTVEADMPLPSTSTGLPTDSPFALAQAPVQDGESSVNSTAGAHENSFENTSSFDTAFGGIDKPNPDSGKSDLEPGLDKELAAAQEALEKSKTRVAELEQMLKEANEKLSQAQQRRTEVAATPRPSAPAPRPTIAKEGPISGTPAPRPSLCVAAVAQAARNCETCVAHAFLTYKGVETMLGHGDFIEGYRVSISGDRLDLQTTNGEVVHKYWSSPDGCNRT